MKNPKIAQILKQYRKLNRLSVPEVSDKLKELSIVAAPKTVYGWESGQTQPTADTLLLLCKMYHINDVLTTFGYKEEEEVVVLSEEEKNIIRGYRANPDMRASVARLLQVEGNNMEKDKGLDEAR